LFYCFKFRVSASQVALILSPVSGSNSSDLSSLDYQVWGNAGILSQTATEARNSFRVYKCTLVDLVCLTRERGWAPTQRILRSMPESYSSYLVIGESHCHWQLCKRLSQATAGMCVSKRWHFKHM